MREDEVEMRRDKRNEKVHKWDKRDRIGNLGIERSEPKGSEVNAILLNNSKKIHKERRKYKND